MVGNASAVSQSEQSNDGLKNDDLLTIYEQICTNIRTTDEISFKLLGAVPLASGVGAGALTILEKSNLLKSYNEYAVIALALLGAVITLGLFRWELRNIQKCNWLIACAAKLERQLSRKDTPRLQYDGIAREEHLCVGTVEDVSISSIFRMPWGKTQAEKLIYWVAITAWLIPVAIVLARLINTS